MVTVARRPVCPVTLTPGDPALASVRDLVDAWSAHDALAELVTMFGGAFPQTDHLEARLASLDKFSTAWDYRARARAARALHGEPVRCQDSGGGARWLIPAWTCRPRSGTRSSVGAAAGAHLGIDPAGNNLRPRSSHRHRTSFHLIRPAGPGIGKGSPGWSHRARRRIASIAALRG